MRTLALSLLLAVAAAAADKPNIVFVLTDDQAAWTIGALGNSEARTPHLDRLVHEGATLANAFVVTPVCSPSRASLLTSRYGTELGITDYLTPEEAETLGVRADIETWPEVLQRQGYHTGLVGKWHLGMADRFHPTRHGYDEFVGFRHGGMESKDPEVEEDGKARVVEGFTTEILTEKAIDFVRRAQEGPFALSLHYWAPHANQHKRPEDGDRTWLPLPIEDWRPFADLNPHLPSPRHPRLDAARAERMMREYLASIAGVDRNVGRLLATLDELGLAENTVVIFSSDHGYNMAHHGIWHKGNGRWLLEDNQGSRPNLWDTSLRVPAIVRWPGKAAPGSRITRATTNLDWHPTLTAIAGAEPVDGVRGRSLLPLLEGEDPADWDETFFAQYTLYHGDDAKLRAVRTPGWKLIRDFAEPSRDALYHLAEDPQELYNLLQSGDPAAQAARARLERLLAEHMRSINDPEAERFSRP